MSPVSAGGVGKGLCFFITAGLADYHVLYRVTPVFEGDNLFASGVLMEGYSVEDEGAGISFCVYAYNVQPGVTINYATGESELTATPEPEPTPTPVVEEPASVVLMDNNILACEYGIGQLAGLIDRRYRIDLNQGMDARLVTPEVADILARLKCIRFLRFSCDHESQIGPVLRACELLKERGVSLTGCLSICW